MQYVSTRGEAPALGFCDMVLSGLAPDGGLYVPETWPTFSQDKIRTLVGKSYHDIAFDVMKPFVEKEISDVDLKALIQKSYAPFRDKDIAPVKKLKNDLYLLELFHGPTLAFKDYALQFLGNLFDYILHQRKQKITILGATSGDTGSAAIEGCRGREAIEIFILHPKGRVSEVQRRQMTTVLDGNVHNIAVEGTFDDCQNLVKDLFNTPDFRKQVNLSAVNSINWVRIMAQVVYYFTAALTVTGGERPVNFSVPTGNFGNIFAAFVAYKMGLPIQNLIVGTNRNDILARYFASGVMKTEDVVPSLSPSMDIQISSNFERLLFEMHGRDGAKVKQMMQAFKDTGTFEMPVGEFGDLFMAYTLGDDGIQNTIAEIQETCGELIDPHTAVGVAAAQHAKIEGKVISLACAHPAKFPDAVKVATGMHPSLPDEMSDLFEREERFDVLGDSAEKLKTYILNVVTA